MILSSQSIGTLTMLSLSKPAIAARFVIAAGLRRDVLWSLLLLVSIANATLVWVSNALTGPTLEQLAQMPIQIPAIIFSPLFAFVFLAGALVITVHVLHWLGAAIGGTGGLDNMLAVLVWLQGLRVMAQIVLLVLMLALPSLAGLFGLAIAILSLWILVHFVNEAAGLGSLFKTVGVLLSAMVGIILGLSFILTITGLATMGIDANV
ncbi:MAG: hypothetical protein ACI9PU_002043 [Ascidiaceihabitans sp.]|jgi:hypothetical protein|tara:strand:+ start:2038 stop:2658 length:621 start_codon:yes stop_codon:yes gene_type:complete